MTNNEDVLQVLKILQAELAQQRLEIANLRAAQALPVMPSQPRHTSRRNLLKGLAGGMLAGVFAATQAASQVTQARVAIDSTVDNTGQSRIGALVYPRGLAVPSGTLPTSSFLGLLVSDGSSTLDLAGVPSGFTAIYASGSSYGVYADASGTGGTALYGNAGPNASGGVGVFGKTTASNGSAVFAIANGSGVNALYASANGTNALAGNFIGNVTISGSISKASGTFKIDHPLDPANKYLYHSFVESPDMKNIYDGVATLDAKGQAEIQLPTWFEALNHEFRYQLTCLGQHSAVYIAKEIANGKFRIAGGTAGLRVSWQVTGIRQDKWAKAHPTPVEEQKTAKEQGRYLHPELYGEPAEKQVGYRKH